MFSLLLTLIFSPCGPAIQVDQCPDLPPLNRWSDSPLVFIAESEQPEGLTQKYLSVRFRCESPRHATFELQENSCRTQGSENCTFHEFWYDPEIVFISNCVRKGTHHDVYVTMATKAVWPGDAPVETFRTARDYYQRQVLRLTTNQSLRQEWNFNGHSVGCPDFFGRPPPRVVKERQVAQLVTVAVAVALLGLPVIVGVFYFCKSTEGGSC